MFVTAKWKQQSPSWPEELGKLEEAHLLHYCNTWRDSENNVTLNGFMCDVHWRVTYVQQWSEVGRIESIPPAQQSAG